MGKHSVYQIHEVENGWLLIQDLHTPLEGDEIRQRLEATGVYQDFKQEQKRFVFTSSTELLAGLQGLLDAAALPVEK
jgi:hypothetical protein